MILEAESQLHRSGPRYLLTFSCKDFQPMDSATKPVKPSSNISDIVYRFAKVCRLKSIGVFPGETPNHHHGNNGPATEDSSDATEEAEYDFQKIHPQPIEETLGRPPQDSVLTVIPKLFDTISALKLAYIHLQEAHIPYDPEKIRAADDLVVCKLKALSDIKRSYKEKKVSKSKSDPSSSDCLLLAEIRDREKTLRKLQSQVEAQDSVILQLQQELETSDRKNADLSEKLKQKAFQEENARKGRNFSPNSLSDALKAASESIHDFAKPLISFMKASGWNLDRAADSIEESIVYSKRSHKKYAFEAYLSRRMFHGFSIQHQPQNVDEIARFKDPFDALVEVPNSTFAKFCRLKYPLVVHSEMEASFFGNLDQRTFVLSGRHPRTPFYQAFVKMAKWVWIVQGLAASVKPKAEIFGVRRGSEFSEVYMESVVKDEEDAQVLVEGENGSLRVGFMVTPGFRVGEDVIRSRVYPSRMNS